MAIFPTAMAPCFTDRPDSPLEDKNAIDSGQVHLRIPSVSELLENRRGAMHDKPESARYGPRRDLLFQPSVAEVMSPSQVWSRKCLHSARRDRTSSC
jgi:hypothetical protein